MKVVKNEEIRWRQRSKIQWLKQRDKNTLYFHRIATSHKRYSTIDSLKVEGSNITNPTDVKLAIKIFFYQNIYKETEAWRLELQLQGFTCINKDEKEELHKQN